MSCHLKVTKDCYTDWTGNDYAPSEGTFDKLHPCFLFSDIIIFRLLSLIHAPMIGTSDVSPSVYNLDQAPRHIDTFCCSPTCFQLQQLFCWLTTFSLSHPRIPFSEIFQCHYKYCLAYAVLFRHGWQWELTVWQLSYRGHLLRKLVQVKPFEKTIGNDMLQFPHSYCDHQS